jgi:hypothetical protein
MKHQATNFVRAFLKGFTGAGLKTVSEWIRGAITMAMEAR